jgi:hypothetical protein
MFVGFKNGNWSKAFYNDENCTWEYLGNSEAPIKTEIGDSEFSYPYKEYMPTNLDSCGELLSHKTIGNNELVLSFANLEVALTYDTQMEIENVAINT